MPRPRLGTHRHIFTARCSRAGNGSRHVHDDDYHRRDHRYRRDTHGHRMSYQHIRVAQYIREPVKAWYTHATMEAPYIHGTTKTQCVHRTAKARYIHGNAKTWCIHQSPKTQYIHRNPKTQYAHRSPMTRCIHGTGKHYRVRMKSQCRNWSGSQNQIYLRAPWRTGCRSSKERNGCCGEKACFECSEFCLRCDVC